jgi:hypothetical protein
MGELWFLLGLPRSYTRKAGSGSSSLWVHGNLTLQVRGSLRWDNKVWLRDLRDSDHWVIRLHIADPSSRQRECPTETRPQISDRNIPTGSNIWSQVPQGCSIPRHIDRLTVSRKVTSTSTFNLSSFFVAFCVSRGYDGDVLARFSADDSGPWGCSCIATDGRSAGSSWCRSPFGTYDWILVSLSGGCFVSSSCRAFSEERAGLLFALKSRAGWSCAGPMAMLGSLKWDSNTWLWVLRDYNQYVIALQITGP